MENLHASAPQATWQPPPAAAFAVDRYEEALRVLDFLLSAGSRLAILYGKRGGGKTSLVRQWIVPAMPTGFEAFYADCDGDLPERVEGPAGALPLEEAVARRALVFLDSFERPLDLADDRREPLLARLCALVRSPHCAAIVVLILDESRLDRAFGLRARVPELAHAALEIEGIGARASLAAVRSAVRAGGAASDPAVLEELSREAAALDPTGEGLTPELLRLVDEQLRFLRPAAEAPAGLAEVRGLGGLGELLRGALERTLDELAASGLDREVGAAILGAVVKAGRQGRQSDFGGLADRLEATGEEFDRARAWLAGPGGMLRARKDGALEIVPPILGVAVEREAARRAEGTQDVRWILREGARAWEQVGTLLAPESFERVDRQRRRLEVSEAEAQLMVQCALRYQDDDELRRSRAWLRRVPAEPAKVEALLSSLFDGQARVRRRGATLLGAFPQPEVREQLQLMALRDTDARVREAAVDSLRGMPDEGFHTLLVQEVEDERSRRRAAAVDALRIFPDERTVAALAALVQRDTEPGLRRKAVEALGALETSPAAAALVSITLADENAEDRQAAADGLGSWRSPALVDECLERLRAARPPAAKSGGGLLAAPGLLLRYVLAGAVTFAGIFVHPLPLLAIRRWGLAGLVLLAEAAAFALGTARDVAWLGGLVLLGSFAAGQVLPAVLLLRERRADRLAPGSFRAALALTLFCAVLVEVIWWLHGFAHALTGRWRRAAQLFALEALGLALVVVSRILFQGAVSGLARGIWEFYSWLGWFLFWGSLVYDVAHVVADSVLRSEWRQRRWPAYRALLSGRVAPGLLIGRLGGADRAASRWARRLLRRGRGDIDAGLLLEHVRNDGGRRRFVVGALARSKAEREIQALCDLWSGAEKGLRATILAILARRPTEASLAALARLRPQLGRWQRARAALGPWQFRLRVWPKGVLAAVVIALPVVAWAGWEGVSTVLRPYRTQERLVENPAKDAEDRIAAAEFLAKVHPEKTTIDLLERVFKRDETVRLKMAHAIGLVSLHEEVPLELAQRAIKILADELRSRRQPEVRLALLTAAAEPRLLPAVTATFEPVLVEHSDPTDRRDALAVLESARAVEVLAEFVARSGGSADAGARGASLARRRQDDELRLDAVAALGRIGSVESLGALRRLAASPLPRDVAAKVRNELARPLRSLEAAYAEGRFDRVIAEAQGLLAPPGEVALRPELLNLLGKAECSAGRFAADKASAAALFAGCRKHLTAARRDGIDDDEARDLLARSYLGEAEAASAAGRPNKALALSRKALEVDDSLAAAHATQATAYESLGQHEAALAALAEAATGSESESRATYHTAQAKVLLERGKERQAQEALREAIARDPDDAWAFDLLRQSYRRRHGKAERELLEQKRRHPASAGPGLALAHLYHEDLTRDDWGAYRQAMEELERLRRLAQDGGRAPSVRVLALLAEAQLASGRYQEAADTAGGLLEDERRLDAGTTLTLAFVRYVALLLLGDERAAEELRRLEQGHAALPEGFVVDWEYSGGTARFLGKSPLPADRKQAVQALARLIGDREGDAEQVFAANRDALGGWTLGAALKGDRP